MVTIRLTRIGKKHTPIFRLAVMPKRSKRDGDALEYVGQYNLSVNPHVVKIDKERIKYWLEQGAKPSETVERILIKNKLMPEPKTKRVFKGKPGRKRQAALEKEKATKAEEKPEPKVEPETKPEVEAKPETKIKENKEK